MNRRLRSIFRRRRSADIPVRSNARTLDGFDTFTRSGVASRCCGQECPRSASAAAAPRGVAGRRWLLGALVAALLMVGGLAPVAEATPDHSPWERSLVTLEITHNVYEFLQPWSKRTEQHRKTGVVVGPRQVLTTAEHLSDRTLVRLQKGGRGRWWTGQVEWIDFHANLALLTTSEASFWTDLRPATLTDAATTSGALQVARWREGKLETVKGEVNRVTVKRATLSFIDQLHLEMTCEIKEPGWGEAVTAGKGLAGLVVSHQNNVLTVLPSCFIRPILEARQRGEYRGLGYFAFVWQMAQSSALHHFLRQSGDPQGVVVAEVDPLDGNDGVLQPRDVLLQVDGFDIDMQGDYADPAYGKLLLENLATRRHWAGDQVRLKIWRDGAAKEVKYRLPKAEYPVELVPQAVYDSEPEYLIVGGLVLQPLTEPYLRSWGPDWRRRVPFRLAYYEQERPTAERRAVVILSMVLPDPFNIGYQDSRYLALRQINGKPIASLRDVQEALQHPRDGFHILQFERGESLQRIVLDAGEAEAATRRVMERYGIQEPMVVAGNVAD